MNRIPGIQIEPIGLVRHECQDRNLSTVNVQIFTWRGPRVAFHHADSRIPAGYIDLNVARNIQAAFAQLPRLDRVEIEVEDLFGIQALSVEIARADVPVLFIRFNNPKDAPVVVGTSVTRNEWNRVYHALVDALEDYTQGAGR